MKRLVAAALTMICFASTPVFAGDNGGAFDKWLNSDAPECVLQVGVHSDRPHA